MKSTGMVEFAGFRVRLGASLVDALLMLALFFPIGYAMFGVWPWEDSYSASVTGLADFSLNYVLPGVVELMFWSMFQATPGKMLFGLKIVDARTGRKPTLFQFVRRYIGYYISIATLFLGFAWAAFDRRKQGLHDKLAGTVVVRPFRDSFHPAVFSGV